MPTRVYEDTDCVWKHKEEMACLGSRALIVTGRHSAKENGSLDDVIRALKNETVSFVIFDEIEENPSTKTVVKAAALGMAHGVDFVVAIGGGSPMDAAKAIALLIKNKSDDEAYLYDKNASSDALPVIAIPTTCGTGSEVTGVSVITVHEKRTKCSLPHKIFPMLAFIDGTYLQTLPQRVLNDTALDALSHLWESWLSTLATDYSKMLARQGLLLWSKERQILQGDREPLKEDYDLLMHTAALAGMSIAHGGTTIPHSLSYAVTYELSLSHGRAVGQFLSGFLAAAPKDDRETMLKMAGFDSLDSFESFFHNVYGRQELSEQLKKRLVTEVFARKEKLAMVPFCIDEDVLWEIINYG